MSSQRVAFVAGATGYTGRAVVQLLTMRGVRCVAHVRPDSARLDAWRGRFAGAGAEVCTAPWRGPEMGEALADLGVTEVYALTGTTNKRAKALGKAGGDAASASHDAVDFGLTRHLVDACLAAGTAPFFVYLSSLGADADSRNSYLRARGRAEDAVAGSGLPFCALRASFITGPDRAEGRPMERASAVVTDGLLAALAVVGAKRLRARYRSIDADRLAALLVELPLDETHHGRVVTLDEVLP